MKFITLILILSGPTVFEIALNQCFIIYTYGILRVIITPIACLAYALLQLKKARNSSAQERKTALRQEQNRKALEQRLQAQHYTDAEIEHLICTADISAGQKDVLRRKYFYRSANKKA